MPTTFAPNLLAAISKLERVLVEFSKNKVTFCYCISEYPTAFNKIQWNEAKKYDGFSDHTLGIVAPIIFTMLKKRNNTKNIIIEGHEGYKKAQNFMKMIMPSHVKKIKKYRD